MILRRNQLIGLILTIALGLSACASFSTPETVTTPTASSTPEPPTATPEPMALTVNGEGITVVDFNAEVARYTSAQTTLGNPVDSTVANAAVTDDLIAQLLLAQAARANGFHLEPDALQARIDSLAAQLGGAQVLEAWQASQGYTDQSFWSALKRAAESAWMRDKIIAAVPVVAEQVHIQQILLYNQETAQSFLTRLNGGAEFDALAFDADPLTRGDLGWVPRGYLLEPAIEEVAFAMQVGGHSDVIPTEVGFHILRILARDPARTLSPDALLTLQELALKQWVDEQRVQASVILALP